MTASLPLAQRVQNLNLQDLYEQTFEVTEKLDGTSFTCYKYEGHFGVCSRNWELKEENNTYWNIAKKYELDKKLPDGYALQGEIIGSGIQKNLYKLNNQQLYVFNVLTIPDGKFLDYLSSQVMLKKIFGFLYLELVPLLNSAYNLNGDCVESLLNFANKFSLLNDKVIAEGLVFSSILNGEKVAFKVISNQFLLKY